MRILVDSKNAELIHICGGWWREYASFLFCCNYGPKARCIIFFPWKELVGSGVGEKLLKTFSCLRLNWISSEVQQAV